MNHIPKKHWMGCAVATAAMLSGRRYEEVAAHWPDLDEAATRHTRELCALLEAVTDYPWYLEPCWDKPQVLKFVPPPWPVAVWIQDASRQPNFGQWIVIKGDRVYDPGEQTGSLVGQYPLRNWVATTILQPVPPLRERRVTRAQTA
jgi:hypothetical protein